MENATPYLLRIIIIALIIFLMYSNIEMLSSTDTQSENMGKQLKSAFSFFAGMGILVIGLLVDFIINLVKKRKGLMIFDVVVFVLLVITFFGGYLISGL